MQDLINSFTFINEIVNEIFEYLDGGKYEFCFEYAVVKSIPLEK